MWVFLSKFGIKPYELEQISVEDQNVLWTMIKYEQERQEHDKYKEESAKAINKALPH